MNEGREAQDSVKSRGERVKGDERAERTGRRQSSQCQSVFS